MNGDMDSYSLYFYGENAVDFDTPEGETYEGIYSVDGNTMTVIFLETDIVNILEIEDNGTALLDEQGECFYLEE